MKRSFYHYLLTERHHHPKNEIQHLANLVFEDIAFPKHSEDYDELSSYLEMVDYVENMRIFDKAWESYLEKS
ncbi:MAG: YozE family protein [Streptococcaceae bacterium]|jgi:uncharacterized protein YozE (UPF0346 family)|nr:YozE family protein [Streptococcaceae bacterium]